MYELLTVRALQLPSLYKMYLADQGKYRPKLHIFLFRFLKATDILFNF